MTPLPPPQCHPLLTHNHVTAGRDARGTRATGQRLGKCSTLTPTHSLSHVYTLTLAWQAMERMEAKLPKTMPGTLQIQKKSRSAHTPVSPLP